MVRFLSLHAHCYLSLNCFCRDLRTTPLLRRFPPRRRPTQLCLYLCTGSRSIIIRTWAMIARELTILLWYILPFRYSFVVWIIWYLNALSFLKFIALFAMGMGTNLAFSFGWQKFKSMKMSDWHYLWGSATKYTYLVIINTLLCCFCFIGAFLGKVVSAVTSVDAIHASPHNPSFTAVVYPAILFPFKGATITATCKPNSKNYWKYSSIVLILSS